MRRSRITEFGLTGALVTLCASVATADSADLRPKFQKDRITYYRTVTKITQRMETPRRFMEQDINREFGIRLTVKQVHPDGGADLEYAMLYVAMDTGLPQSTLNIDTRKPADSASDPEFNDLSAVMNRPILLHISGDGKVKGFTGAEVVLEALPRGMAHLITEDTLRKDQHLRMPGRKAAHPTKLDGKWEDQSETPFPGGKLIHSIGYTLKGIDSKAHTAEIVAESVLRFEPAKDVRVAVSVEDAKSSGRLTWDLAKGELVRSESEVHIALKMGRSSGQSDGGMSTQHTTKTTTERVALKDLNLPADTKGGDIPGGKLGNKPSDE